MKTKKKMKQYVSPEAWFEALEEAGTLLSGSTETISDSSIEIFEDNGDIISW